MAEETMKLEIIKRETVKPSTPTPSHLKTYKLSFVDQLSPAVYGRIIYFYTGLQNDVAAPYSGGSNERRSKQLKKSLSETLARFYPVAGTVTDDNLTVECNDKGAQYVEARFSGLLSAFLEQPASLEILQQFFPAKVKSPEAGTWPLLLVQATFFDCGGLALGICTSHKLIDAPTMGILMKSWAQTSSSRSSDQPVVEPAFNAASYFPPRDLTCLKMPPVEMNKVECETKRFVFDKPKIMVLKAKVSGEPSRVQAVTALIWKCAMAASRMHSRVPVNKFYLSQAIDIRKRAEPPLPENLIGNVVGIVLVQITNNGHDAELQDLVAVLKKGMREFTENNAKRLGGDEASEVVFESLKEGGNLMVRNDTNGLIFTSLCNAQLYETIDFGWGKPIWVTVPVATGGSNFVTLMDTKCGGVEAWVTLTKEDMATFETNPELLEFAYPSTKNHAI
ncbi:Transferase [Parasponia andersonii]|uniref:Transferase n=1 Tax=Parasponia andersonii TaxID=3476 RepID=A0A2P5CUL3_PARAD|nr:Transferase [Parasponia andersonii]